MMMIVASSSFLGINSLPWLLLCQQGFLVSSFANALFDWFSKITGQITLATVHRSQTTEHRPRFWTLCSSTEIFLFSLLLYGQSAPSILSIHHFYFDSSGAISHHSWHLGVEGPDGDPIPNGIFLMTSKPYLKTLPNILGLQRRKIHPTNTNIRVIHQHRLRINRIRLFATKRPNWQGKMSLNKSRPGDNVLPEITFVTIPTRTTPPTIIIPQNQSRLN